MEIIKDIYINNFTIFNTLSENIFSWLDSTKRNVIDGLLADKYGNRELFQENILDIQIQVYNMLMANRYRYNILYDTTVVEYNPMENYDMTEHTETNIIINKGSETDTNFQGTQTSTGNSSDNVFAFDSSAAVNNSTGSMSNTSGAREDSFISGAREDKNKEIVDHNRHGNIGVLSGQDLIDKSRNLVANLSMEYIIAADIAHCISLAIY